MVNLFKNRDEGTPLLTFVHNVEDVPRVAAETIQPRDN
ncbi:UNVERIFIED_ORG: hypothetical protein GGI57_005443 [Rhizobium aethiopicum]